MQKHRPLTLQATIGLPTVGDEPSDLIRGFIHLVRLYRPFDEIFVGLWNKSMLDCSTRQLAHLQHQHEEALPMDLQTTETQAADLRTSQQWLRTMVWQLSISKGFLSSASPDTRMTFRYPIEIAKDLVTVTGRLSQQSMEVHSIGLVSSIYLAKVQILTILQIEKVFDVTCTLIDVMACVPIQPRNFELGPQDYLNQLLTLISTLRGGDSRYISLVRAKISETLPNMGPSITQPLPLMVPGHYNKDLKDESTPSSTSSSPMSSPPFMHYYLLA